jgi:hypothetical protein
MQSGDVVVIRAFDGVPDPWFLIDEVLDDRLAPSKHLGSPVRMADSKQSLSTEPILGSWRAMSLATSSSLSTS